MLSRLAYGLSSLCAEKSTAAGLALGVWFFFVLVFDLALLALLVLSKGQFNPQGLPWLLLLNPTDVYRLINLSGFGTGHPVRRGSWPWVRTWTYRRWPCGRACWRGWPCRWRWPTGCSAAVRREDFL